MDVNIPAGVDSGMTLRLTGQGEEGPGGKGHLYIAVNVEEHPVFERDGADVHVRVRLSISEAILGSKIVIPTLEGDVSLNVPPGTQSGDRRVMTGRGMPGQRGHGHQYIHFDVLIPRQLTSEQQRILEAFRKVEEKPTDSP